MAKDDDVPEVFVTNERAMIAHMVQWVRENEAEVERLAADTGKRQEKSIGMHLDNVHKDILRIEITCEPRQFAKLEITGLFAELIKKHLRGEG